jgi:hypothetical protein
MEGPANRHGGDFTIAREGTAVLPGLLQEREERTCLLEETIINIPYDVPFALRQSCVVSSAGSEPLLAELAKFEAE